MSAQHSKIVPDRTGQDRTGQDRTGQDRTGQHSIAGIRGITRLKGINWKR